MLLNDTEITLKTEISKHNPFSNKSQIQTVTYRKKISTPTAGSSRLNSKACLVPGQILWMVFLQTSSNLSSSNLLKYIHLPFIPFPASARLIKFTGVQKASFSDSAIYKIWITTSTLTASTLPWWFAMWQWGAIPAREGHWQPMRLAPENCSCPALFPCTKVRQNIVNFNSCLLCFTFGPWNNANYTRRNTFDLCYGKGLTSNWYKWDPLRTDIF